MEQREFRAWKEHPVTLALFKFCRKEVEDRKDAWANGELLSSFAHEQFVKEAVAKGYINAMQTITEVEVKDLFNEE